MAGLPSIEQVSRMKSAGMTFANKCSADAWQHKKLSFNERVEKSWHAEGGSFPFRLVRDPRKPPVLDMTIQMPIRLAPQRWNPAGKAWLKVLKPQDFPVGCALLGDNLSVNVVSKVDDPLQVDRFLTRREASSLFRSFVLCFGRARNLVESFSGPMELLLEPATCGGRLYS